MSVFFAARRGLRQLPRYRQVVAVLARHGFGFLLDQLGLTGRWRRSEPAAEAEAARGTLPEHLRLAFEELGTTFIKVGQILSTRADLLPAPYIASLSRLQDNVPPESPEAVRTVITEELGAPPELIFAAFDDVPIASASIGQVHAALLPDGTSVVVKVQRPHVEAQVNRDLEILADLVRLAEARTPFGAQYDLTGLAEEFSLTLRAELDYLREGRNAELFRRNFHDDPTVRVPRVFFSHSTRRVLTMERLSGVRISDREALRAAGFDPHAVAVTSARIVLKETFEHGFFHADPHPGNFFVLPGPTLAVMDFGMVGRLDDVTRETLLLLFVAVVERDFDRVIDRLGDLGVAGPGVQRHILRKDLSHLLDRFYGIPLRELDLTALVQEVLTGIQRHHLQLPSDLAMLLKTIMMNEAVGRSLDPEFQLADVVEPYARRLIGTLYSPSHVGQRLRRGTLELATLGLNLPQRVNGLLRQVERGDMEVSVSVKDLNMAIVEMHRMVNRLAITVIIAAMIVSLAVVFQVYRPETFEGALRAGIGFGFAVALLGGVWLIFSIIRSGRG